MTRNLASTQPNSHPSYTFLSHKSAHDAGKVSAPTSPKVQNRAMGLTFRIQIHDPPMSTVALIIAKSATVSCKIVAIGQKIEIDDSLFHLDTIIATKPPDHYLCYPRYCKQSDF